MAQSPHDDWHPPWLLGKQKTNDPLKFDDESKKLAKAHAIATWPLQVFLRGILGNYEIDIVIGTRHDQQALCPLIDLHHGSCYVAFHDSKMAGLSDALKMLIATHHIKIHTCIMNNGRANNLLSSIIDWS